MSFKSLLKAIIKPSLVSVASQLGSHKRVGANPKLWVLMYHRILPKHDTRFTREEPGMLVQPDTFAMHIQELKRHFDLISLSDWIDAKNAGKPLPRKACAITFDDGWQDNYEFAFPALTAEKAPATLFAVADKIGTNFQFWPNAIANLLYAGAADKLRSLEFFRDEIAQVSLKPTPDQVASVIAKLKSHSDAKIYAALTHINWQTLCNEPIAPALMDWHQLKAMSESGLVDIGSHTCTHRRLTNALSLQEMEYEIVESKKILRSKLDMPVDLFCFPNGDYTQSALDLVKANYKAGVTTKRGINIENINSPHELTRIGLHDEVSNSRRLFRARLSGWI